MCYRLIIAVATASLRLTDMMNNDFRTHNVIRRVSIVTGYTVLLYKMYHCIYMNNERLIY